MIDVELLRQEQLIDLINEFQEEDLQMVASGVLPSQSGVGRSFNWDILGVPRDIDTFEGHLSPAGTRAMEVISNQTATLARTFKSVFVPGGVLMDLRNPGTETRQRIAQDRIGIELQALGKLINRQNEFLISQALQDKLVVTIDGLAHTISYFFSATHKLLVIGGGGGNAPLAWTDPAADVVTDIRVWKVRIAEDSGFVPTTVWTSSEVIDALIKNDFVQSYFASTQAGVQALTEGRIGRFMGLNWIAFDGTFKNSAGAITRYLDKRDLIMMPNSNPEWGFFRLGSDVIPTDDKRNMTEVIGRYAYSTLTENPAAIALFAGEQRLPIIRIPDALLVARVLA